MAVAELSEAEREAIEWLRSMGGCILTSDVEDKNSIDPVFRNIIPGHTTFRKLEKKGLVYYTEEEETVFDDGLKFTFTNEIYLVQNP